MEKIINQIKEDLNTFSKRSIPEKFDLLISSSSAVRNTQINDGGVVQSILSKIEILRYEIAYNKSTELTTSRLDKMLALEALNLSRLLRNTEQLKKSILDVLYFEANTVFGKSLKKELDSMERTR